jgi:uncharacterized membrane protein
MPLVVVLLIAAVAVYLLVSAFKSPDKINSLVKRPHRKLSRVNKIVVIAFYAVGILPLLLSSRKAHGPEGALYYVGPDFMVHDADSAWTWSF